MSQHPQEAFDREMDSSLSSEDGLDPTLDLELPPELANVSIDQLRERIAREKSVGVSREDVLAMKPLQRFCYAIQTHWIFQTVVLVTIFINLAIIVISTFKNLYSNCQTYTSIIEAIILGFYVIEFVIKLVAQPKTFWLDKFNLFDFVVLVIAIIQLPLQYGVLHVSSLANYFIRLCRVSKSLRAFRLVTYIKGLTTILVALGRTLKGVIPLLFLIVLFNYVFAIVGYFMFKDSGSIFWSDLIKSFLTLFTYVTVDNWTDVVFETEEGNPALSVLVRIFSILYTFVGSFLLSNMFVGVVLQSLTDATQEEEALDYVLKASHVNLRRAALLHQQRRERLTILAALNKRSLASYDEIVQNQYGRLSSDTAAVASPLTRLQWVSAYLTALAHEEGTLYKMQMLHYEMAGTLCEMLDLQTGKEVLILDSR